MKRFSVKKLEKFNKQEKIKSLKAELELAVKGENEAVSKEEASKTLKLLEKVEKKAEETDLLEKIVLN